MRYRPFHITNDSKYKTYLTNSVLRVRSTRFIVIILICYVSSADQAVKPNWNNFA